MKIPAENIRFLSAKGFWGRGGIDFVGRQNTIQLADTALVVEGNQKTLGLILVDILFRQALSEWTAVTIPYSRIVRCKYSRNLLYIILLFLAIFLPAWLLISMATAGNGGLSNPEIRVMALVAGMLVVPVALTMVLLHLVIDMGPRATLAYRRHDGRLMRICFRIRPRALQRQFLDRLEANRRAANELHLSGLASSGRERQ